MTWSACCDSLFRRLQLLRSYSFYVLNTCEHRAEAWPTDMIDSLCVGRRSKFVQGEDCALCVEACVVFQKRVCVYQQQSHCSRHTLRIRFGPPIWRVHWPSASAVRILNCDVNRHSLSIFFDSLSLSWPLRPPIRNSRDLRCSAPSETSLLRLASPLLSHTIISISISSHRTTLSTTTSFTLIKTHTLHTSSSLSSTNIQNGRSSSADSAEGGILCRSG